jgi:predicted SprT family Zn-dependent metalloprotease
LVSKITFGASIEDKHRRAIEPILVSLERAWALRRWSDSVSIEISDRMQRSLGSYSQRTRTVRLSAALFTQPDRSLVREVLCHELAHAIVHQQFGRRHPHGPEWRELVRRAGFEGHARTDFRNGLPRSNRPQTKRSWIHRCPVCQMTRRARRPVSRWRCAACVEVGLDGILEITESAGRRHE